MSEDELVDVMQDVMEWFERQGLEPPTDRQLATAVRQATLYRVAPTKTIWRMPLWEDAVIFILHARRMRPGAIARRLGRARNTVASRIHPTRRMELMEACRQRRLKEWERLNGRQVRDPGLPNT
jgi:hypothetical protein